MMIGLTIFFQRPFTSYEKYFYSGASLRRDAIDALIVSNVKDKSYLAAGCEGSTNG
jgi:hypothetical protein